MSVLTGASLRFGTPLAVRRSRSPIGLRPSSAEVGQDDGAQASLGPVDQPFRWNGEYAFNDFAYKIGARYYDASQARWTQTDPVPSEPRYAYAGGDPINRADPTGAFMCGLTGFLGILPSDNDSVPGVTMTALTFVGGFFVKGSTPVGILSTAYYHGACKDTQGGNLTNPDGSPTSGGLNNGMDGNGLPMSPNYVQ